MRLKLNLRFWLKVYSRGDCWEWRGYRDNKGYGRIGIDGRNELAHRVAFHFSIGCGATRTDTGPSLQPPLVRAAVPSNAILASGEHTAWRWSMRSSCSEDALYPRART